MTAASNLRSAVTFGVVVDTFPRASVVFIASSLSWSYVQGRASLFDFRITPVRHPGPSRGRVARPRSATDFSWSDKGWGIGLVQRATIGLPGSQAGENVAGGEPWT